MIDSFFQDVIEMHSAPVPDVSVQKSSSGAFGKVLIHLPDFAKEKLPKAGSLPFLTNTRHTTLFWHTKLGHTLVNKYTMTQHKGQAQPTVI